MSSPPNIHPLAQSLMRSLHWRPYRKDPSARPAVKLDAGTKSKEIYFVRTVSPPVIVYVGVADAGNTIQVRLRAHLSEDEPTDAKEKTDEDKNAEERMVEASAEGNLQYAFLAFRAASPTAAEARYIEMFGGVNSLWNKMRTNTSDLDDMHRALAGDYCPLCRQSTARASTDIGSVVMKLDLFNSTRLTELARRMVRQLTWRPYAMTLSRHGKHVEINARADTKGVYFVRTKKRREVKYVGISDAGRSMAKRLSDHLRRPTNSKADCEMGKAERASLEYAFMPLSIANAKATEAYYITAFGGAGTEDGLWNRRHTGKGHLADVSRFLASGNCPVCGQRI